MKNYRDQFPILNTTMNGKPLAYFDHAATSQKPQAVIDAMNNFYQKDNANIHRGVYALSQRATDLYENARQTVAEFLGTDISEIVFTRSTTEAINLVAETFAKAFLQEGDEILLTEMEHHANLVPWQQVCNEYGAKLRFIPVTAEGELDLSGLNALLTDKTKLVSLVHVSNSLGTINPVKFIVEQAHAKKIPVLVDGAQAVPHMQVNMKELDADFYVFSGHKAYGPTGIGVLYAKKEWLDKLPPYQTGGDMIESVTYEESTFKSGPAKFEAGTPNIAGAVGLAAALTFLQSVGPADIQSTESELLTYATEQLQSIDGLRIIGQAKEKAAIISFVIDGVHPHDIGTVLDQHGIAVRAGHHCTQPLMKKMGVEATTRVSLSFLNTKEEIDRLIIALGEAKRILG